MAAIEPAVADNSVVISVDYVILTLTSLRNTIVSNECSEQYLSFVTNDVVTVLYNLHGTSNSKKIKYTLDSL